MSAPGAVTPPASHAWRKAIDAGTVVVSTVLGAAVGYLSNVWIMAVRSDGYNVKAGSAAAAPGNVFQGSIFWLLAPAVIFGIGGYWRAVGTKRFFFEIRRIPRLVMMLGHQSWRGFQAQFLVGALVGVLASLWIGPTLGLVMSVGFVAMLPTAASRILSSFGQKLTQFVASRLSRPSATPLPEGAGILSTVVGLFGGATALLIGFFVASDTAKGVIAGALALLLVLLAVRGRSTPAALVLVVLAAVAVGAFLLLRATPAFADDGGWVECTGQSWWSCPGSDTVRVWGILGASLGAIGGAVGGALGGIIGSWPAGSVLDDPELLSPGDPGNALDPTAADAWIRSATAAPEFTEWLSSHQPSSPLTPEDFDDYMGWRHDQGLDDPRLPEPTGPRGEAPAPGADVDTVAATEGAPGPSEGVEGTEGGGDDLGTIPEAALPPVDETEVVPGDFLDDVLGDEGLEPPVEDVADAELTPPPEVEDVADAELTPPPEVEDVADAELTPPPEVEDVADAELTPPPEAEDLADAEQDWERGDTSRYRTPEAAAAAELARERAEAAAARERAAAAERPSLDGDPRFDDSMHDVDPDARAVHPETGEPLLDPRTGEPLPVDADGNVKYGDEWVDPKTAAQRTALDATHITEVARGQQLVEDFKDLQRQLGETSDPGERAALEAALRDKATEINSDYQAKIQLKNEGRTADVAEFDRTLHEVYGEVDTRCTEGMSERGVKIGGREFTADDMREFRNPSSAGTASIDRDYGLDESKITDLETRLAEATPGSAEAQQLSRELLAARQAQQVTVDYDKLIDTTRAQLDAAEPGSPRAQELGERLSRYENDAARHKTSYLEGLNERLQQAPPGSPEAESIRTEIAAAEQRVAGAPETPVSKNTWNDIATDTYNDKYTEVTGRSAEGAFQAVTQRGNVEAYGDPNVLRGDPKNQPYDPARAEQTASVTGHKVNEMNKIADEGHISHATAAQEAARGTAKDANTKLFPTLENDPRVDPGKYQTLRDINDVLTRAGTGEIPPGQIDSELRKIVPGDPNMNLQKAVDIIQSNLEAATKYQPEVPRESGLNRAFSAASDLAALDANRRVLIAQGLDPTEATAVAAAQTHAGNVAQASGVADPRVSMVGGALLPRGVDNVLPDRAIENYVGTGYQGGRAAIQSLNDSIESGRIDTTALDNFAEGVANRPGADPFKGFAQSAQLAGEEWARTDGGNVVSDMRQIIETGAGAEVANQSMSEFQADVAAGKHGSTLQGLDHVARIASELGVDPSGTVGQFVEDVKTIYNNGVGEGYWSDAATHTVDVLHDTPIVGHVITGYEELAGAAGEMYADIEQRGVVEFTKGAAQDVANVAGYVYDETTTSLSNGASYIANSASNFGSWVKSYF